MLGTILFSGIAFLVVGCSSSGTDHATPTTAAHDANGLGGCPASIPLPVLRQPNADMPGITTKLVPLDAAEVRVCKYAASVDRSSSRLVVDSHLRASAFVQAPSAAEFTHATNRLPPYNGGPGPSAPRTTIYLLTFANPTKQVTVLDAVDAAPPTNGRFIAVATPDWQAQVSAYASGS